MIKDIDINNNNINRLVKDKNKILGKIQTIMNLKAHSKAVMTEEQITSFQRFYADYTEKSNIVNNVLTEIEERFSTDIDNYKDISSKNNTDYSVMIEDLKALRNRQHDAIFALRSIIETGKQTLTEI